MRFVNADCDHEFWRRQIKTHGFDYWLAIIGGGPGGLAPLLAAHRVGLLDKILSRGVVVIEQSAQLGCGEIGSYGINSDSTGATFADCIKSSGDTELTALVSDTRVREVASAGEGSVPLQSVDVFMSLVGETLGGMISNYAGCAVLTRHSATRVQRRPDGWRVSVTDAQGQVTTITVAHVVSATGAHQPTRRLGAETVGGVPLVPRFVHKLLQSGDVFVHGGLDRVARLLAGRENPRIAIIGGSTSAAAVAHALLHRLPSVKFGPRGITLMHRRPLRIYYPSVQEALAEGYTEFTEDDICPISGRVFRFAGFRLDSRELIMQARGIGGRAPEPRLHLHRLQQDDPCAVSILDRADIVIAALGYRPRAIPVFDLAGEKIELMADQSPQAPLVDGQCRILDSEGAPIPRLYGIGLAAGFVPRGKLGGEPSFRGQANGLWLWQNDVGRLIVDALIGDASKGGTVQQPAAASSLVSTELSPALEGMSAGSNPDASALT